MNSKIDIIKNFAILLGAISLLICNISAQNTFITQSINEDIKIANEKFTEENYSDAMNDYERIISRISITTKNQIDDTKASGDFAIESLYWNRALCSYYLMNNDVDVRFKEYSEKFPYSNKNTKSVFYIANWYMQKTDYDNALKTYRSLDVNSLPENEQLEYYYKIGYCYFTKEDYTKAKVNFERIKDSDSKFASPSKYYYAHILYEEGKYDLALKEFEDLSKDKYFKKIVPYYICQIYYFKGDYDKLIEMAPKLSASAINSKRATELNRMLGDAYYKKGDYDNALMYIRESIGQNEAFDREDNYLMGYCLMQTGNTDEAIKYFKPCTIDNDSLSQNALYYLGYCYLKNADTLLSKNAYKGASDMNFDKDIQQEALFNYAKLSINDPSPYNEAIKAFQTYLHKSPKSPRKKEVQSYLVQLYERTKNYKDALELLDGIDTRTKKMNEIYQKVALNRGIELYNMGEYNAAIETFGKSLNYPFNNSLTASAYYLQAEGYFALGQYNKSISSLNKFYSIPNYQQSAYHSLADYSFGYNLFKQQKYALAKDYFQRTIKNNANIGEDIISDSKLRLGDCEYMSKNYKAAVTCYNEVINSGNRYGDYAYYQKAMTQGAQGNQRDKISTLNAAIHSFPNTTYMSNMHYELANAYLALDDNKNALKEYEYYVENYPSGNQVRQCLGKIGSLEYELERYDDAIKTLDKLVRKYPSTSESKAALITIQNIYKDRNAAEEYFEYLKTVPNASISNVEKESMLYSTAESQYMDGKYAGAVYAFEKYMESYPKGENSEKATYYLADSYMQVKDTGSACKYYLRLAYLPGNDKSEMSILRATEYLSKDDNNIDKVQQLYERLDSITSLSSTKITAERNLMEIYKVKKMYNESNAMANKLLSINSLPYEVKDQAYITLVDNYLALKDTNNAKTYLDHVIQSSNGVIKGKAYYTKALILYNDGNLNECEKVVRSYSKNPSDEYYLAECFILWADIFSAKGNDFQAIQTLQSIINNCDNVDVVGKAKAHLDAIKLQQNKAKEENIDKTQKQNNSVDEVIIK